MSNTELLKIFTQLEFKNMASPSKGSSMGIKFYPENSEEVLKVKREFILPEKTVEVLSTYVAKIKEYSASIDLEKEKETEDAINKKAEILEHTINMKPMDIE